MDANIPELGDCGACAWLSQGLHKVLMALELLHLLLCEVLLVGGVTLEGNRIVGVLGMPLVIDVILSVLPIRELGHVVTHLLRRCIVLGERSQLALGWQHFEGRESSLICSLSLHGVRVNDTSFLLQIEGIFFCHQTSDSHFVRELLLIVR